MHSPSSIDCRARRTASLPESVHSERIPTFTSIFVTLSQVLKSSSTTNALRSSSSAIFSMLRCSDWIRNGRRTMNSVPLPCSVRTSIVTPHHIHNILGNCHAKSCPLSPADCGSPLPFKRRKDPLYKFLAHTDPAILYPDLIQPTAHFSSLETASAGQKRFPLQA